MVGTPLERRMRPTSALLRRWADSLLRAGRGPCRRVDDLLHAGPLGFMAEDRGHVPFLILEAVAGGQ